MPSKEPITEVVNHLDLARQRKFATGRSGAHSEAEIDEAAIALVELSVLVYSPLDEVVTSISKFPEAHLGLFGKKGQRRIRKLGCDADCMRKCRGAPPMEYSRSNGFA